MKRSYGRYNHSYRLCQPPRRRQRSRLFYNLDRACLTIRNRLMTRSRRAFTVSTFFTVFPVLAFLPPAMAQAPATGGVGTGAPGGTAPGSDAPSTNSPTPGVAGGLAPPPPNRPLTLADVLTAQTALYVSLEVRQAHLKIRSAQAQAASAQTEVAQGQEVLRLADLRGQGGLGTFPDVLNALAQIVRATGGP